MTDTITANLEYRRWLDGFCRKKEAAELRGVSENTIEREVARGKLKPYPMSDRTVGYRRREVLMIDD